MALDRFDGFQTQVLGLSVDSTDCLKAWAESLGGITYPLLSDFFPHGHVAQCFGVLRHEGYSERAIFVIDKRGIVRYVDVHAIDQQPDNEVLFQVLHELEPTLVPVRRSAPTRAVTAAPSSVLDAQVVLYCTPWCPDCRRVRDYFKGSGIKYAEIDITQDRAAAMDVRGWAGGYETTPTIKIGDQVVVGYDKEKLARMLAGNPL